MLEMRNFLQKKINKKGFTLAELLVVVAIIAILVAVSIPIFTGKLNEAKESTDKANVRAAKAAVVSEYLQNDTIDTKKDYWFEYDADNGKVLTPKEAPITMSTLAPYGATSDNKDNVVVIKVDGKATADAEASPDLSFEWVAGTPAAN